MNTSKHARSDHYCPIRTVQRELYLVLTGSRSEVHRRNAATSGRDDAVVQYSYSPANKTKAELPGVVNHGGDSASKNVRVSFRVQTGCDSGPSETPAFRSRGHQEGEMILSVIRRLVPLFHRN